VIALFALAGLAQAQTLGTLFHTPKERELFDRQRRGDRVEVEGQAPVQRREPVVTGYVKRSDGKSTVFLDRRPHRAAGERIQDLLTPRIIERFEEPPVPAEPLPIPIPMTDSQAPATRPRPAANDE
jgi:hypothetical protein